jgi:O-antigen/teichoic acid export membrane protein
LRESAPIALSGVFIALYFRVDSVMLHALRGEHDTGLYGGIYRFFEASVLFSAAYRSVLFPVLSRAADGPTEALRILCRKSLRLHLLVTLAVATFVSFEARPIVALVLGPAYLEAARGLVFLMWALPGAFMADTLLHVLTAQGRQRAGARAASLTALFNVALNLLLIPRLSFVGASIATAASEALCFGLLFLQVRAGLPGIGLSRVAARPLLAAGALAAALAFARPWLPAGPGGLALAASLGATLYAATLALVGGLERADLETLASALPIARFARRS